MLGIDQQTEFLSRKVCVKQDHLAGEGEFVDYALSGAVAAGKEFEILKPVVLPVPVDVMDGFFAVKLPPEMLFHHVAMFKNVFLRRRAVHSGDAQFDVTVPRFLSSYFWKSVFCAVNFANPFVFTLFRAGSLFGVDRTSTRAPGFLKFFSAIFACGYVLGVTGLTTTFAGAFHRTIKRISAVFDVVCGGVRRPHGEGAAAVLTRKFYFFNARRRASVNSLVRVHARSTAKLSAGFPFASDAKGLMAMLASFLGGHVVAPLSGDEAVMAWTVV